MISIERVPNIDRCREILDEMSSICTQALAFDPLFTAKAMAWKTKNLGEEVFQCPEDFEPSMGRVTTGERTS